MGLKLEDLRRTPGKQIGEGVGAPSALDLSHVDETAQDRYDRGNVRLFAFSIWSCHNGPLFLVSIMVQDCVRWVAA